MAGSVAQDEWAGMAFAAIWHKVKNYFEKGKTAKQRQIGR